MGLLVLVDNFLFFCTMTCSFWFLPMRKIVSFRISIDCYFSSPKYCPNVIKTVLESYILWLSISPLFLNPIWSNLYESLFVVRLKKTISFVTYTSYPQNVRTWGKLVCFLWYCVYKMGYRQQVHNIRHQSQTLLTGWLFLARILKFH